MISDFKFYIWATVYKVTLEIVYYSLVAPNYTYFGLVWNPSYIDLLFSYTLFAILLILLPKGQDRPSYQLTQLLFFIIIVPILCFFWQTNSSSLYVLYVFICCVVLFTQVKVFKPIKITFLRRSSLLKSISIVHFIFIISFSLLILFTLTYGSFDLRALNFSDAYEMREESQYNVLWGYLINWLGKLFIPFCIVSYFYARKYLMLFFSTLMQIYFYLCTGYKTILFSVLFLLFFSYVLKKKKFKIGVPAFYTLSIAVSSILFLVFKNLYFISILPIRQLTIPAFLNFLHFNFFSMNPKLLFSEGLLGKILGLTSPYSMHSTFLVSTSGANANTGFLADAYDNGGFMVMVIFTFILGLVLLYVDSISFFSKERHKYTALMLYPIVILTDTSLLTTLFTSGLAILLVLLLILASEEMETKLAFKSYNKIV